jgi:hypothetical protein
VYVSDTSAIAAQGAFIFLPFDGTTNTTAPVVLSAINTAGNSISLPDSRFPPTIQFINGSMDLGTSDIYDDEMLTSQLVANHTYLDVSDELEIAAAANTFYYTPSGAPTTVTLEETLTAFNSSRHRIVAAGVADAFSGIQLLPDRRPVETRAKLLLLQVSNNFDFVDVYAVEAGTSIDEANPVSFGLPTGQLFAAALAAGSYDIYMTEFSEKVELAGPYRIDVVLGDVVDLIIVDTVDPAVLDALFLSGGPTP